MRFHNTSFVPLAATIAVAALTVCLIAPAAHAQQLILNGNQTYSAQDGTYQNGVIYVRDNANLYVSNTQTTNGVVGVAIGSGNGTTNVFGGSVTTAIAGNTSTILVTNGTVDEARGNDSSKINVSGGTVTTLNGNASSTATISGGTVTTLNGNASSTATISGGTVTTLNANSTNAPIISGGTVITLNANRDDCVDLRPGARVRTFNNNATNTIDNSTTGTVNGLAGSVTNIISGGAVAFANAYATGIVNISGGTVFTANANANGTVTISGGAVTSVDANVSGTVNISGGTVSNAFANASGTVNISGGTVIKASVNAGTITISGGDPTNGILLYNATATANFVGTGLAYAYLGYGSNNGYGAFADRFTISGNFGGAAKTYDLYIRSDNGSGGPATPNTAPRQFLFNGAAPTVVPEAGSLALLLPALGILGTMIVARRRRAV